MRETHKDTQLLTSHIRIISGKENSRLNRMRSHRKQKYMLLDSWLSTHAMTQSTAANCVRPRLANTSVKSCFSTDSLPYLQFHTDWQLGYIVGAKRLTRQSCTLARLRGWRKQDVEGDWQQVVKEWTWPYQWPQVEYTHYKTVSLIDAHLISYDYDDMLARRWFSFVDWS